MLIKPADDRTDDLAELERLLALAEGRQRKAIEEDLRKLRAGLKAEAESAYLVDFHFAESRNWAILHDLRIVHSSRVAQIDHLLINRWMECYVLETKNFAAGVKITEDGEFLRWNAWAKTYEGMPSPLLQNERHIQVLEQAMSGIELPTRLGLRIAPCFQTLVLVSPAARIDRPKRFDSSRVIKADQLKQRIWKDIDDENPLIGALKMAKLVASETVEHIARQLAALHQPIRIDHAARYGLRVEPAQREQPAPAADESMPRDDAPAPACKQCQATAGHILHGKYGYYFKCAGCGGNTAIRFACLPGHKPRLRKDGERFYRECGDCGSSAHYFTNPTAERTGG